MGLVRSVNESMQQRQHRRIFKIVASIVAVVLLTIYFLPATLEASRVTGLERQIFDVLFMADLEAGEGPAVEFAEQGSVTLGGTVYQDERLSVISDQFFNDDGKLFAAGQAAMFLVASEKPGWIPDFMLEQPGLMIGIWALASMILLALIWCGMTWPFIQVCALAFLLTIPFWFRSVVWNPLDYPPNMGMIIGISGIALLGITFALFTRLVLLMFGYASPMLAIAHGVVREAVRLRLSAAFILVLLVILPLIPLWIDPAEPLRYQIQTYLSRSISITFVLLACMTLVLGCATVAFEIRDRQIWQVMTKPVSRLSYLLGKWLGLVGVNGIGLLTASIAIFISVEYMKTRPAQDAVDEMAVRNEVLTARSGTYPIYPKISLEELERQVDEKVNDVAEYRQAIDSGERTEKEVETRVAVDIMKDFQFDQRRVAPGEAKKVVFRGLDRDLMEGTESRLRFLFHCGSSDTHEVHPVIFSFPKTGEWIDMQYVPTVGSFLRIPGNLVEDDGTLELEILNASYDETTGSFVPAQYSLNWDKDKLEILFKISDFESNFVRAMLVDWFKLAFLGILAVVTGAFLSFPVACLLSFAVFIGGTIAPFLGISLDNYSPQNFVEQVISLIAYAVHCPSPGSAR